jgi:hypothetical protein
LATHKNGQNFKDSKSKPGEKTNVFIIGSLGRNCQKKMHALHKENKHFTLVDILHFAKEELEYPGEESFPLQVTL